MGERYTPERPSCRETADALSWSRSAAGFGTRARRRLYVKVVRIHLSVSDLMNIRIPSVSREDLRVLNH
jgi:hypothetical protein